MRIALVMGSLGLGGTETQVCRYAQELQAAGHQVCVLAVATGGPLSENLDRAGVPWKVFDGLGAGRQPAKPAWRQPAGVARDVLALLRLWRELRHFRADVCHGYLFYAYAVAMPVAMLAGVPVRVSGRRGLFESLGTAKKYRILPRLVNLCTHAVVANARAVAAELIDTEGLAPHKIWVIGNGVDVVPQSDVRAQPATGAVVARLIEYKGHRDLLTALALLEPSPHVRLVGDGPEHEELVNMAEEVGLSTRVRFEGERLDGRTVYEAVQFAVLASHHEGMPNAVLEAMAAGLPVVATAVGGVVELIDDGVTGLLVPPRDPVALAAAIDRLAGDPDLRMDLGTAARAKAATWSWPACVDAHLELYGSLSRPAKPPRTRPGIDRGRPRACPPR